MGLCDLCVKLMYLVMCYRWSVGDSGIGAISNMYSVGNIA